MKGIKLYNRHINTAINWYEGRTPYYYDRGKYNKAYKVGGYIKGFNLKANKAKKKES